jgi:hypothetical protein
MAHPASSEVLEKLAAAIGEAVYLDVAKWHLYLNDAKLHLPLAEQLYPLIDARRLSQDTVSAVLQAFPVPVGGGRRQIPLLDLLPKQGLPQLLDVLEDFQANL